MKHPDYPGASAQIKNGKAYWRFRAGRNAPHITLPGQPGDEAFEVAYQKATLGQPTAAVLELPGRAMPRTFGKAARTLEAQIEWLEYDPATQAKNARLIERFLNMRVDPEKYGELTWRDSPVECLDADRLRLIIRDLYASNKTVAKHMLVAVKKLLWVAIDIEKWIKPQQDPSLSIRVRVPKSKANPAWPISVRERFEARHPIGSAARTCYALGFWLGNRRSDIASVGWDDLVVEEVELFDGELVEVEAFDFTQRKNRNRHGGREMFIPVVDKLAAALASLERQPGRPVLATAYGRAFSEKALTGQMAVWTKQAGIEPGYTLHGLRRTFGTYLAECGIQARAIMDAMGHTSLNVTEEYVRDANRKQQMVAVARAINEREGKRDAMKRRAALRIIK